jgi:hypothetical protein
MARLRSTTNQGPRLGKASTKGKVAKNPVKPSLAAKIKNSQGFGGGIRQGKGGAKFVSSAKPGRGIKQSGTGARKPAATKVGVNKLNKAPIKAQPKYPKNKSNNLVLHNKVSGGDLARTQKAGNFAAPKLSGGGFKSFIGGK